MGAGRDFLHTETSTAGFASIPFDDAAALGGPPAWSGGEPFLDDLHIRHIINAITDGLSQYDLEPLSLTPLAGTSGGGGIPERGLP